MKRSLFVLLILTCIYQQKIIAQNTYKYKVTASNYSPDVNETVTLTIEYFNPNQDFPDAHFYIYNREGDIQFIDSERDIPVCIKKGERITKAVNVKFTERKLYHIAVYLYFLRIPSKGIANRFTFAVGGAFELDERNINQDMNIERLKKVHKNTTMTRKEKQRAAMFEEWDSPVGFQYPKDTTSLSTKEKEKIKYFRKKNDEYYKEHKKEYDSLKTVILNGA